MQTVLLCLLYFGHLLPAEAEEKVARLLQNRPLTADVEADSFIFVLRKYVKANHPSLLSHPLLQTPTVPTHNSSIEFPREAMTFSTSSDAPFWRPLNLKSGLSCYFCTKGNIYILDSLSVEPDALAPELRLHVALNPRLSFKVVQPHVPPLMFPAKEL
jgi:hypothetical protein